MTSLLRAVLTPVAIACALFADHILGRAECTCRPALTPPERPA